MMVFLNVKQRTEREFRPFLMGADEVFKVHSDGKVGLVEGSDAQDRNAFRFPRHLVVTSRKKGIRWVHENCLEQRMSRMNS